MNKKGKGKLRILSFFERYEKYFVWWLGTIIFCTAIMFFSVKIYDLKLPLIGWQVFVESLGTLGFIVSAAALWWSVTSEKRQAEKKSQIETFATIISKQEELFTRLLEQQETDKRLEIYLKRNSDAIDDLRNQIGRINAQVHQFESEAHLRRRIEKVEKEVKNSKRI